MGYNRNTSKEKRVCSRRERERDPLILFWYVPAFFPMAIMLPTVGDAFYQQQQNGFEGTWKRCRLCTTPLPTHHVASAFFFLLRGIASPPHLLCSSMEVFCPGDICLFFSLRLWVSESTTHRFFFCWVLGVRLEKGFVCVCDSNISSSARLIWHPSAPFCVCVSTEERRGGAWVITIF